MRVSELLGKPLISLAEAEVLGVVFDVVFDSKLKKVAFFLLFSEDEELAVAASSVVCADGDALVVRFCDQAVPLSEVFIEKNNPMLALVYNTQGKNMGKVTDIELDKLNVNALYVNDRLCALSDVASFSSRAVVVFDGRRVKLTRAPSKPSASRQQVASIMPVPQEDVRVETQVSETRGTDVRYSFGEHRAEGERMVFSAGEDEHNPQRIIGNYDFLLGRTVADDIKNQRGDVIIARGIVVSPDTVEIARRYGRLVELTLHSQP